MATSLISFRLSSSILIGSLTLPTDLTLSTLLSLFSFWVGDVFRLSFGDIRETIDIDKAVERVEARIVDLYNSNLVVPNNG